MVKVYTGTTYTLIIIYHLGALENSIHIIADNHSQQACVVDPAWDVDLLIKTAQKYHYEISQIWLTHWHPDHTNATDMLADKTGAKIYAGRDEKPYLSAIKKTIAYLNNGQTIAVGKTKAEVIFAPGHSAGELCFLLENDLITGDTLFIYGAGHCALPGANARQLFHTMQTLKTLPDEVFVRCGHDYGDQLTTTLGEQKQHNPFLMIDNEDDFVRYRQEIHDNTRTYPMAAMSRHELNKLLLKN